MYKYIYILLEGFMTKTDPELEFFKGTKYIFIFI